MKAKLWERSVNPHQAHSFSADECEAQVRAAVTDCAETFNANKKKLRDLSPHFWAALLDLEICAFSGTGYQLIEDFPKAYRRFGAPGDFGYGTPCGDALRNLYDWWNAWVTARNGATSVVFNQG